MGEAVKGMEVEEFCFFFAFVVKSKRKLLRLRKIQAICSRDLSQLFEIEFVRDKRVPLLSKVLS